MNGWRFIRGWGGRRRFQVLLLSLLALIVLAPLMMPNEGGQRGHPFLLNLLSSGVLLSGLYSVSRSRGKLLVGALLFLPTAVTTWLELVPSVDVQDGDLIQYVDHATSAAFFVFLSYVILDRVFRSRQVTKDTLYGIACVYLLVSLVFQSLFMLIYVDYRAQLVAAAGDSGLAAALTSPFTNVTGPAALVWDDLLHFSFTALTTVGYGNVSPVHEYARVLADLESVFGVLFTTILVARLVALYRHEAEPADSA